MESPATRSKTRARCEGAWRKGMPLKETSDGFPILMKPSMNCEYVVKGTQDIAYVGFPDVPKEELVPRLRAFLTTIPRLTAEELEEADDGIYTWIYASVGGSEPTFYASRTTAMLELGTVHYSIATAVGATAVHGAGEVWKHEGELTFNFLSGTFMEKWQLPEGCTLKIMEELLKEKLKETFAYVRRAKGLAFRKTDPTFISTRFLELTTAELEGYVKAGFKVCIHNKANKAECKSTKSACKKPMERVEDMKGGKIVTLNAIGEEVPAGDPSAVKRFDTNTYKELPLGGRRRKTKKAKKARRKTRRRGGVIPGFPPKQVDNPPPSGTRGPMAQAMEKVSRGPLASALNVDQSRLKGLFAALKRS